MKILEKLVKKITVIQQQSEALNRKQTMYIHEIRNYFNEIAPTELSPCKSPFKVKWNNKKKHYEIRLKYPTSTTGIRWRKLLDDFTIKFNSFSKQVYIDESIPLENGEIYRGKGKDRHYSSNGNKPTIWYFTSKGASTAASIIKRFNLKIDVDELIKKYNEVSPLYTKFIKNKLDKSLMMGDITAWNLAKIHKELDMKTLNIIIIYHKIGFLLNELKTNNLIDNDINFRPLNKDWLDSNRIEDEIIRNVHYQRSKNKD